MLESIIRSAIAHRWLMLAAGARLVGAGCVELHAPADRRHPGHHQRPGADQHRGAGLFAARGGAARHLSDRDGASPACRGSITRARFRATACPRSRWCSRTAPISTSPGSRSPSACSRRKSQLPAGARTRAGTGRDRAGRNLHVHGGSRAGRTQADGKPWTPTDLRTLQDWVVRPQLRNAQGVTEVNTIGGFARQIHVTPDPAQLRRLRLHAARRGGRASRATTRTSAPATSSATAQQYLVRVPGQVADLDGISRYRARSRATACRSASRDVADVGEGRSCAPARRRRTAAKSFSARCSC